MATMTMSRIGRSIPSHRHFASEPGRQWLLPGLLADPLLRTMAPRTTSHLTPQEKARTAFQRGQDILNKAKRTAIARLMESDSSVIDPMCEHLKSLGHDIVANLKANKKAKQTIDEDADKNAGICRKRFYEPHPLDIPGCITSLGGAKLEVFLSLLTAMEPSSLSAHSLKALPNRRQRVPPKSLVLELFTFCTGMPDDLYLGVDSDLKSYMALEAESLSRNVARRRRGRDLVLPPRWKDVGVYKLSVDDGVAYLDVMGNPGIEIRIREQVLDMFDAPLKNLVLKDNYSEQKAVLTVPGSPNTHSCIRLFPDIVFGSNLNDDFLTPSQKRNRFALGDCSEHGARRRLALECASPAGGLTVSGTPSSSVAGTPSERLALVAADISGALAGGQAAASPPPPPPPTAASSREGGAQPGGDSNGQTPEQVEVADAHDDDDRADGDDESANESAEDDGDQGGKAQQNMMAMRVCPLRRLRCFAAAPRPTSFRCRRRRRRLEMGLRRCVVGGWGRTLFRQRARGWLRNRRFQPRRLGNRHCERCRGGLLMEEQGRSGSQEMLGSHHRTIRFLQWGFAGRFAKWMAGGRSIGVKIGAEVRRGLWAGGALRMARRRPLARVGDRLGVPGLRHPLLWPGAATQSDLLGYLLGHCIEWGVAGCACCDVWRLRLEHTTWVERLVNVAKRSILLADARAGLRCFPPGSSAILSWPCSAPSSPNLAFGLFLSCGGIERKLGRDRWLRASVLGRSRQRWSPLRDQARRMPPGQRDSGRQRKGM